MDDIEVTISCTRCGDKIGERDSAYCEGCVSTLEQEIDSLKKELKRSEEEVDKLTNELEENWDAMSKKDAERVRTKVTTRLVKGAFNQEK